MVLLQQIDIAVQHGHDIRALDRFLIINLDERKIKLINLQEINLVSALASKGHVILTSGIIELAKPGFIADWAAKTKAELTKTLSCYDEAQISVPVQDLLFSSAPSVDRYLEWFNVSQTNFNPFITATYWASLTDMGSVSANSPIPPFIRGNSLTLSLLPKCCCTATLLESPLTDSVKYSWTNCSPSLPIVNGANNHPNFLLSDPGLYAHLQGLEAVNTWTSAPLLLGQLKSHWMDIAPSFPKFKHGIPHYVENELIDNFTELFLTQGDNIITTRAALFNISRALEVQKIAITNPIWQRLTHLSPTI